MSQDTPTDALLDTRPTPDKAWRAHLDRLAAGIDTRAAANPGPEEEPGRPAHVAGALGAVLDRLSSGRGVSLGEPLSRPESARRGLRHIQATPTPSRGASKSRTGARGES